MNIVRALALAGVFAGSVPLAFAQLPAPEQAGNVRYLSGGIGFDESEAFKAESRHWPLTLEFSSAAQPRAQYLADVGVHIRGRGGRTVLDTTTEGPYLLVKLPPGHYTVTATAAGQTHTRQADVRDRAPARLAFVWPASTVF